MEKKTFIPGSEWVYFKLYTGTKTADEILKNELNSFVTEMLKNEVIDKWFFIRYTDPDFHLRLRLHMKEARNFTLIFNQFHDTFYPLVDSGYIWNIQCDTYQREMERYSYDTISVAEDLFFIDSEYAIKLLHHLHESSPEQHRWKLALCLIDSFLTAFSYDLLQRKDFLNLMAENLKKEFGFTRHEVSKQLNDKCRFYRKEVENAMLWEIEVSNTSDVLRARRQMIIPIAEKLLAQESSGELKTPLRMLMTSIIHMSLNRWFRTKNRIHELVIYELLSRYYSSENAKNKYKKP